MTTDPFERAVRREQEEARQRARSGLRIHATVYAAVQVLLAVIWIVGWATGGSAFPWFVFPLLGWGVGLAAHYAAIRFNRPPSTTP